MGATTTPSSDVTTNKRPVKRSYADALQSSRAKRSNSTLPCTPTSEDAFSPLSLSSSSSSSSSCPLELHEVVDECTPEANEKYKYLISLIILCMCLRYDGSCTVPAQRRLSFTTQRRYLCVSMDHVLILLPQ